MSLKYAVIKCERRFLLRSMPEGVTELTTIMDRYIESSRMRLREIRKADGRVIRKLGHKVRLTDGPVEVACTNFYLDDAEWQLLADLPARVLHKRRHHVVRDGLHVVIDELKDGTLLAEVDDGDRPPAELPSWLDILADVTTDEAWTGARLAAL